MRVLPNIKIFLPVLVHAPGIGYFSVKDFNVILKITQPIPYPCPGFPMPDGLVLLFASDIGAVAHYGGMATTSSHFWWPL